MNKQIEVGLLIAGPGVLASISLAPMVLEVFYSSLFIGGIDLLRWQMLGVLIRVISWPMGFLVLAMDDRKLYLLTEISTSGLHLLLIWIGVHYFGLIGSGMAFFGMYVFYGLVMNRVVSKAYGFVWSVDTLRPLIIVGCSVICAFCFSQVLPDKVALGLNLVLTSAVSVFSLTKLFQIVGISKISLHFQQFWRFTSSSRDR